MSVVLQTQHNLTKLHIRNITIDELNLNIILLPKLESIAITDSRVDRVVNQNVTKLTNLQCLNLSNNNINDVDNRLIEDLPRLEQLDLSFNNLTNLSVVPPTNSNISQIFLDISSKLRLLCCIIMYSWASYPLQSKHFVCMNMLIRRFEWECDKY